MSIFLRPGVVDALDQHGRPMEVPLPETDFGWDRDIDDDPTAGLEMLTGLVIAVILLTLVTLGYIAGRLWP